MDQLKEAPNNPFDAPVPGQSLTDKPGNKFGFQWTLQKVLTEGNYKNCWMTIGVSQPIPLAKST